MAPDGIWEKYLSRFRRGLETDLAMVLTPDGTWEKYPLGFGEVAFADPHLSEVDEEGGGGIESSGREPP